VIFFRVHPLLGGTEERQAWGADGGDLSWLGKKSSHEFARSVDWRVEADRRLAKVRARSV